MDPHWGSLSNLQHFVQSAHARGLRVIDDIIVNHGDDLIYSTDASYGNYVPPPAGYTLKYRSSSKMFAPPFDVDNSTYNSANNALTNLFHNNGTIQNFNDMTQVQLGELSGLDDFRTESDYVRSNMSAIYEYWIQHAGFDGFRIDTVKHVDTGFWRSWCPAVRAFAATNGAPNFFMFGEVYDANESLCGSYTGPEGGGPFLLDSVVDYLLYFTVNSVFATATGNTKQIEDHYHNVDANYDPTAKMSRMNSLFYIWNNSPPGTMIGTNLLKVVYSNNRSGLVLSYTRTVIVPPAVRDFRPGEQQSDGHLEQHAGEQLHGAGHHQFGPAVHADQRRDSGQRIFHHLSGHFQLPAHAAEVLRDQSCVLNNGL